MGRRRTYVRRPSDYMVTGVLFSIVSVLVVQVVVSDGGLAAFLAYCAVSIGGLMVAVGVIGQGVLVGTRAAWRDQERDDLRDRLDASLR